MAEVVVVSHDDSAREAYRTTLSRDDVELAWATTMSSAMESLSRLPAPALAIVDIGPGGVTPSQLGAVLRADGHRVPVITMSSVAVECDTRGVELDVLGHANHLLTADEAALVVRTLLRLPRRMTMLDQLHIRVLVGDRPALEALHGMFLRALPRRLERRFPRAPWDFALDAVVDASLDYSAAPGRFDPGRMQSLMDFLHLIARRNLLNRLVAERKRKARERRYSCEVQASQIRASTGRCRCEMDDELVNTVTTSTVEREALRQWLLGATSLRLASILGYSDEPLHEQRRAIKRFKDRVIKRIGRSEWRRRHTLSNLAG